MKTAGPATKLLLTPDRSTIAYDGKDLSFIALIVVDRNGQMVPRSMDLVHFEAGGPGEIVATDNGDPTDMTAFSSKDRKAFYGLALVIVRAKRGQSGPIVVIARSDGFQETRTRIATK
jgi:beta-galactosidase